jgi:hypothetical protein
MNRLIRSLMPAISCIGVVASGIAVVHATTTIRRSHGSNAPLSYAAIAVASPKAMDARCGVVYQDHRVLCAYRSTLTNGTITDNLITLSTIGNGLNKPDDH